MRFLALHFSSTLLKPTEKKYLGSEIKCRQNYLSVLSYKTLSVLVNVGSNCSGEFSSQLHNLESFKVIELSSSVLFLDLLAKTGTVEFGNEVKLFDKIVKFTLLGGKSDTGKSELS